MAICATAVGGVIVIGALGAYGVYRYVKGKKAKESGINIRFLSLYYKKIQKRIVALAYFPS